MRAAPFLPLCFPPLRGLAFPPAPLPPLRPTFLAPRCRDLLKPPLRRRYAAPLCAAFPPYARRCRAATLDPRSASRRSGDGRPRFGHGPAAGAAWRGLRRGLAIPRPAVTPAASTAGLRVELARWRSLASASGVALGVKIGGVLRGVLPRSAALRAAGGGARIFGSIFLVAYP